jgi:hypothetical protein
VSKKKVKKIKSRQQLFFRGRSRVLMGQENNSVKNKRGSEGGAIVKDDPPSLYKPFGVRKRYSLFPLSLSIFSEVELDNFAC